MIVQQQDHEAQAPRTGARAATMSGTVAERLHLMTDRILFEIGRQSLTFSPTRCSFACTITLLAKSGTPVYWTMVQYDREGEPRAEIRNSKHEIPNKPINAKLEIRRQASRQAAKHVQIKGGALMSISIPPRQSSLFKIQSPIGTKPVGLKETRSQMLPDQNRQRKGRACILIRDKDFSFG